MSSSFLLVNGTELLALCCWLLFAQSAGRAWLIIGLQLVASNAVETLALFPSRLDVSPFYLYNIYLLAELSLMSWFIVELKPSLHRAAVVGNLVLLVVWLVESDLFGVEQSFHVIHLLLSALVLCAFTSLVLWELSLWEKEPLHRFPLFWLLLGMVLYFGGIAPVFSSFNYLARFESIMSNYLYWIVRILCAVRYLCVAYACILLYRQRSVLAAA